MDHVVDQGAYHGVDHGVDQDVDHQEDRQVDPKGDACREGGACRRDRHDEKPNNDSRHRPRRS